MERMRNTLLLKLCFFLVVSANAQTKNPLPSNAQLKWHQNSYYFFMHFGPNTFTGKEWGDGKEKTEVFNPTQLDTDQWCRVAKESGAKGIIITAKHHDGFCLWPSKYSTHTVRESGFKRDILAELAASCKKAGLLFGVYLSPWDRNHPDYGTEKYNDVFVNMMTEIFQQYGPIWELWWDGANGEGPNGKLQVYDWKRYEKVVRQLSPQTIVFSDIGPDARWVGNESGYAGKTNWNLLDTAGFKRGHGGPPQDTLGKGNYRGANYIPAEVDVSIRPGWFYRDSENDQVKSSDKLFNIYLESVGRGANLLLNVPPDTRGLIHENDIAALKGLKAKTDAIEKVNLLKNAALNQSGPDNHNPKKNSTWYYMLKKPVMFNGIILEEDLKYGQKIASAVISLSNNGEQVFQERITTIGNKRIIQLPKSIQATELSIVINESKGLPILKGIKAY
ncbi:MAG: glycoside hydrolase family 29 (alpha-L-fucosidase) [Sediminibacterium sp.]|nr:MAG: glycoside hydrolase family 29 (alpha-L-fucosidase) [Sediminibacterium sp.] [Sediminibacterium sp. FEMGT703S]